MKYSTAESGYLVELLNSAIKSTAVKTPPEGIDWNSFVDLAKRQQVYSIIAPILSGISMPEEQSKELVLYNQNELLRLIAMKNELEEISKDLNSLEIPFMLVKGSVIRNYYPQQKMRQMSDVDLLYKEEHQLKLISYMKKRGYHLRTSEANSDDFFKPPFYTFEFHRSVFDERDAFSPEFDLWKNAVNDSERPFEYHISNEDIFIYSLCHMYDHYCQTGCGIRFLCDIYVLMRKLDGLDWEYVNSQFENFGFAEFCENAIGLTKAVFDNSFCSEKHQELFDFMISGGVYGNGKPISVVLEEQYGGSRIKYILKRLFPSKKHMKGNFIILRKYPFLLPVFYVVRLFQGLKYNGKSLKNELKNLKNINGG